MATFVHSVHPLGHFPGQSHSCIPGPNLHYEIAAAKPPIPDLLQCETRSNPYIASHAPPIDHQQAPPYSVGVPQSSLGEIENIYFGEKQLVEDGGSLPETCLGNIEHIAPHPMFTTYHRSAPQAPDTCIIKPPEVLYPNTYAAVAPSHYSPHSSASLDTGDDPIASLSSSRSPSIDGSTEFGVQGNPADIPYSVDCSRNSVDLNGVPYSHFKLPTSHSAADSFKSLRRYSQYTPQPSSTRSSVSNSQVVSSSPYYHSARLIAPQGRGTQDGVVAASSTQSSSLILSSPHSLPAANATPSTLPLQCAPSVSNPPPSSYQQPLQSGMRSASFYQSPLQPQPPPRTPAIVSSPFTSSPSLLDSPPPPKGVPIDPEVLRSIFLSRPSSGSTQAPAPAVIYSSTSNAEASTTNTSAITQGYNDLPDSSKEDDGDYDLPTDVDDNDDDDDPTIKPEIQDDGDMSNGYISSIVPSIPIKRDIGSSLLELAVGPAKHQVKEFNILPTNILHVNYRPSNADYIVVNLLCDKRMRRKDSTIFLTAVSARRSAEESSTEIAVQNLKISKEMIQGRTKGFKFYLLYTLVANGERVACVRSDSFFLWSNINQQGFPRQQRDQYLQERRLVNKSKRKR